MKTAEVVEFLGISKRTLKRYVDKGSLTRAKVGKDFVFSRDEVIDIAKTIVDKKKIYRPDLKDDPVMDKALDPSFKDHELLTDFGKQELLRITAHLRDKGILDISDKGVIMRYALAIQMKDLYLKKGTQTDDSFYFSVAKQFQSEIQYSEKALGITAESASKLTIDKPREKSEMETLLNG